VGGTVIGLGWESGWELALGFPSAFRKCPSLLVAPAGLEPAHAVSECYECFRFLVSAVYSSPT